MPTEIILGVDPSLRGTGWGVLETDGVKFRVLGFGVIENPSKLLPSRCLLRIREELADVIENHKPTVMAIEGLFYAQNIRTALMMGQARGAALVAAAEAGLEIFEYAPRRVKQSTVGVGHAAKNQVGFMVRALLKLTETPPPDAADALAIALTHANTRTAIVKRESL
jgi:crossover junction endodeoxyribonuclease RuvC